MSDTATARPRRIGLYGPFGWGNLGDAAIQEAMLHNLRLRLPDAQFLGFSLNPANTEAIHGIPAVSIVRHRGPRAGNPLRRLAALPIACLRELRSVVRAFWILRRIDDFLISGGGQISDDWGGPWDHPYAMLKWMSCARLAGCRVLVVSVGAGPFRDGRSEFLFRLALRLAHARSYRDAGSKRLLASSTFTRLDPVCPDVAFSLPVTPQTEASAQPLVVGISPLCWYYPKPGPWPEQDASRYRRHLSIVEAFALELLRRGHRLVLFSSQIRNDRYAFDDLLAVLRAQSFAGAEDRVVAEATEDLPHLLRQLSQCDLVLSSRLHGVILSYAQHIPVLSLSYDPKIDSVMEQFAQSAYCLDIEAADSIELIERFDELLAALQRERAQIAATATRHRQELAAQYDRLFGPPAPAAKGART